MLPTLPERKPAALLIATAKAVAAIAVLSVLATHWLASGAFDQVSLKRLVADAAGEPATTGSILKAAANGTKLDPCAVPRKP